MRLFRLMSRIGVIVMFSSQIPFKDAARGEEMARKILSGRNTLVVSSHSKLNNLMMKAYLP